MNELEKMIDTFIELGIECSKPEPLSKWDMCWYGMPQFENCVSTHVIGSLFVFDGNGKFVCVGVGDELPDYIMRVNEKTNKYMVI